MTQIEINIKDNRRHPIYFGKGEGLDAMEQFENIVTDQNVFNALGKRFELEGRKDVTIIPAGEASKTRGTYNWLQTKLGDVEEITAFGGGVITDLVGYVASTLKRGVPLTNIPTSLVGMIDAAIGGKNGVNKGKIKNHFGTFYQPEFVIVDPIFLDTLPEREFRNGVAEIIKYGAISKGALLERCAHPIANSLDLEEIMEECIKVKAELVERDEHDKAQRRALNFGHTIGHGLELPLGLSHGEAVAIGLVYESRLATEMGLCTPFETNLIKRALEVNGLPTRLPDGADPYEIIQLMKKDKKGSLVFAFDENNHSVEIPEEEVREILNET